MNKINKLVKLSVCALLALNFIFPAQVLAGVVTNMVEVGTEEREVIEECMVGLEECIDEKDRIEITLKSRIDQLMAQLNQIKSSNSNLQKQVGDLRSDNSVLARKIDELKISVTEKKEVAKTTKVITKKAAKTTEARTATTHFCLACKVGHVIGPVLAIPVGAVVGTVRGATNMGVEFSDKGSDALGESLPGQLVGKIGGGAIGAVFGAVAGMFKGLFNGIRYGFTRPFSTESFSIDGDYATDFDPIDFSY